MSIRVQRRGEIIPLPIRQQVSVRYKTITKAINQSFWGTESDTEHSFYVGSYGRNTAINTSDIDILVELPKSFFLQLNNWKGNIQSSLLQVVRQTILEKYPRSEVHADGQVVQICFSNGIDFEIVPAFKQENGKYWYPDTNQGGRWRSTNPKAEQDAMYAKNKNSNGLLYDTCKHIRFIRDNDYKGYHLSGIVIDSFIYQAIGNWIWSPPEEKITIPPGTYEKHLLDVFRSTGISLGGKIRAPGSLDIVSTETSFYCLEKILEDMT